MAEHQLLTDESGLPVYFKNPHSPSQRESNENMNGLLRQYFPKGPNLARHTPEKLQLVAARLISRPRKPLPGQPPRHSWKHCHTPQIIPTVATFAGIRSVLYWPHLARL